jgi:hypothetical protein
MPDGRVLVAFDDGPLEPSPTWTRVDDPTGSDFPLGFVAGYDTSTGRQTVASQTDTGTASLYVNDHKRGVFDGRNSGSAFFGKLDGRQIMFQLYNPVTDTWEPQFRGHINDYGYDIDGSSVNIDTDPVNVAIQIDCVDIFDYLTGYGVTPGLDGDTPPAGSEDQVFYAATSGTVDERLIQVMTNANIDPAMYGSPSLGSGNVKLIAWQYAPDSSALQIMRDCADAEFPLGLANIYVDRYGKVQFRGRYGRFDPDDVAAEVGSTWDFTRWSAGDGKAILADATRAQMRVLAYARARSNLINSVMCWPQGLAAADMPSQVYADPTSITDYGRHSAPAISDLLTGDYAGPGTLTPGDAKQQCQLFAELLVKNQKDPREAITSLQVKAIRPSDARASATWGILTRSDISHIVNVTVGYPGGTGLSGASPDDDYYIEGRQLQVRPLNPDHDDVELDLEVSPAVWSMDTHSVFPAFGS